MTTLRIGVDARPLQHPHSGIGRYTLELLRAMIQQTDHHWYLYSTTAIPESLEAQKLTSRRLPGANSSMLSTIASQLLFPRWAAADQLSAFWAPRHHLPIRQLSIPTLVTVHDMVWKQMPDTMPASKALLERLLMPRSLTIATQIITVSNSTKQDLVTNYPSMASKVTTILEASSLHELELPSSDQHSDYILTVGTFEPRKNLERCIAGYAMACKRDPKIPRLIIAGNEGWNRRPIGALIQEHQMQDRIQVVSGSTDLELAGLYANCRFLLHPALYEGFALPIVEAMAFGKPIIASNSSSMPEVAGSAALLIDPTSSDSIGDAILQLNSSPELHSRLARNAIMETKRFSWRRAAQETLSLIERVGSNASQG